ncbi:hypothetical protein I6N90_09000 [Paenibacillus sp. GSMTC-2017]|nr:hypothetical protein [Paenibacillus sp. GSMTC-2017]
MGTSLKQVESEEQVKNRNKIEANSSDTTTQLSDELLLTILLVASQK